MWMQHDQPAGSPGASAIVEGGLIPVAFARSRDQADLFTALLDEQDIAAIVGADVPMCVEGMPVLVSEAHYDRASEIIAGHAVICGDWDEDDDYFDDDDDLEDDEDFDLDDEDDDFDIEDDDFEEDDEDL